VFTGIVREIGRVVSVERATDLVRLDIECPTIRPGIGVGDSIAIDGCDLTATSLTPSGFRCDATKETLRRTTLGELKAVNLEPSLTPSAPISGHFVLGHIDGVGEVRSLKRTGDQAEIVIAPPHELMRFIAEKGSIAVSGVGLTVVGVGGDSFSCWLIPYTLENTTLGSMRAGGRVNIEVDVIARYVVRALEAGVPARKEGITEEFLREHGFG
jgi:riboflavin synthase